MTTSVQHYHHFCPSTSINNDTASLKLVISDLHMIQKIICECGGSIGHKANACIISGPKFLSPSLRRKMNQSNSLHNRETNEPPRQWNIQPPAAHFKYRTSTTNTIPMVSYIMGILNYNAIDNSNIEVHPS